MACMLQPWSWMRRLARVGTLALVAAVSLAAYAAPPPARFARIPQTRARLAPSPSVAGRNFIYTKILPRERERLAPRLNPSGKIRRVFYPMGASDVARVLNLFEGPKGGIDQLVVADILAFGTPSEVAALHADAGAKARYVDVGVHDSDYIDLSDFLRATKLTGPAILWELEDLGASDVTVRYLDAAGRARRPPTEPRLPHVAANGGRWSFWSQPEPPAFYRPNDRDVVRIDFRLGGARRSILYVQQDALDGAHLAPILGTFFQRGFDAYVEKAPVGVPRDPRYHALRDRALGGLDRQHGIVVSEKATFRGDMTTSETAARAASLLPGRTVENLPDGFGYTTLQLTAPVPGGPASP